MILGGDSGIFAYRIMITVYEGDIALIL